MDWKRVDRWIGGGQMGGLEEDGQVDQRMGGWTGMGEDMKV